MNLDGGDHRAVTRWAADCAEHVLPYFEAGSPGDDRPRNAIDAAHAWARGAITVGDVPWGRKRT